MEKPIEDKSVKKSHADENVSVRVMDHIKIIDKTTKQDVLNKRG